MGDPLFEEITKKTPTPHSNLNTKHQKLTSNVAITLIALIITIIVMLILVGVTVSVAINGGLFANAKQAKTDTQNAINAENELSDGRVNIEGSIYNSIDEYIEEGVAGYQGDAINVSDYGKQVIDYKAIVDDTLVWRVFYEDKDNVYLISETEDGDYPENDITLSDYIDLYESGADVSEEGQDLMPLAKEAGLFKETNTNKNILATAYLCDDSIGFWDGYMDEEGKATWAMGAPTLELYVASYNATQGEKVTMSVTSIGYNVTIKGLTEGMNNGIYRLKNSSGSFGWLASPFDTRDDNMTCTLDGAGVIFYRTMESSAHAGNRPIVCIPQSNFSEFTLE